MTCERKLARLEHVLIVKVYFERRKIAKVFMTLMQDSFRKSLRKENFLVCVITLMICYIKKISACGNFKLSLIDFKLANI